MMSNKKYLLTKHCQFQKKYKLCTDYPLELKLEGLHNFKKKKLTRRYLSELSIV